MKYIFIDNYQVEFSIKAMCRMLCVRPAEAGICGKNPTAVPALTGLVNEPAVQRPLRQIAD